MQPRPLRRPNPATYPAHSPTSSHTAWAPAPPSTPRGWWMRGVPDTKQKGATPVYRAGSRDGALGSPALCDPTPQGGSWDRRQKMAIPVGRAPNRDSALGTSILCDPDPSRGCRSESRKWQYQCIESAAEMAHLGAPLCVTPTPSSKGMQDRRQKVAISVVKERSRESALGSTVLCDTHPLRGAGQKAERGQQR